MGYETISSCREEDTGQCYSGLLGGVFMLLIIEAKLNNLTKPSRELGEPGQWSKKAGPGS